MAEQSFQIRPLAWDSEFFAVRVGELALEDGGRIEACLDSAATADFDVMYWKPGSLPQIRSIAGWTGLKPVEHKETFLQRLSGDSPAEPSTEIVPAERRDLDVLQELSRTAGHMSRFRLDPRFAEITLSDGRKAVDGLYDEWMRKSVTGELAEAVLVVRENDVPVGVITLGEKSGRADIGILAVDASARGRGYGRALITAAQRWARSAGYSELQVVTQRANAAAVATYSRSGFELESSVPVFHLWKDD